MAKITWHNGEVPSDMRVKQVYGLLFTIDGRMLLRSGDGKGDKKFSLAGGKPEKNDKNIIDTLKREAIEEVNTTINEPLIVGYQEIDEEDGSDIYAQLRMVAIIDNIGEAKPDPDRGITYKRILVSPSRAIKLLDWGEVGKLQIEEATRIAKEQLGIIKFSEKEEYI